MKLKLALLSAGFSFANALSTEDTANCTGHPDPHFRNFHGASFDFQSGCDVVLVKNANMEIHTRLFQQGFYSSIEHLGVKVGNTTVVIKSGSVLYNGAEWDRSTQPFGDGYFLEDTVGGQSVFVRFPPLPGTLEDFGISVRTGFGDIVVGEGDGEFRALRQSTSTSFTIKAYGALFEGSQGLCGEWDIDAPGFADREGDPVTPDPLYPTYTFLYDATEFGEAWRVLAPDEDSQILSIETPDNSTKWAQDSCVGMSGIMLARHLQEVPTVDCDKCYGVNSIVGTLNCLYDAAVLGCFDDIVQNFNYDDGVFYGSGVDADADLLCLDIAKSLSPESTSSKSKASSSSKKTKRKAKRKVKKCTKMGGECVVYCDVTSEDYECLTGLCNVDIEYGEAVPVLVFDKYYTSCACKIPKP